MSAHTKHTPTPWHFYELRGEDGIGYIRSEHDAMEIAHHGDAGRTLAENRANAELIVRAVNSHDELVGLLREVTDKFAEELAVRKPKCATFEAEQQRFARDVDVVNRARTALSKAGGTDA